MPELPLHIHTASPLSERRTIYPTLSCFNGIVQNTQVAAKTYDCRMMIWSRCHPYISGSSRRNKMKEKKRRKEIPQATLRLGKRRTRNKSKIRNHNIFDALYKISLSPFDNHYVSFLRRFPDPDLHYLSHLFNRIKFEHVQLSLRKISRATKIPRYLGRYARY